MHQPWWRIDRWEVRLTSMFVSCGPPTDGQLRAARRLRRLENGLANGAPPIALETPQAARPPGTATAACQLLELVRRRQSLRPCRRDRWMHQTLGTCGSNPHFGDRD